MDCLDKRSRD